MPAPLPHHRDLHRRRTRFAVLSRTGGAFRAASLAALLTASCLQPALAEETTIGSWIVGPNQTSLPIACLMTHTDQSRGRLFVFIGEAGIERAGLAADELGLTLDFQPEITLTLDGQSQPVTEPTVVDRSTVLMRGNDEGVGLTLVEQMLVASRIEIDGLGPTFRFDATETAKAVQALVTCSEEADLALEAEGDMVEAQHARQLQAAEDAAAAASGSAGSAPPRASPAPASGPASGASPGEADQLRDALGSVEGRSPPIAQFRCLVTASEIMGIPDLSGRVQDLLTLMLTLSEDGSLLVNGTSLAATMTDPPVADGNVPVRAAFDAAKVIGALQGAGSGRAPVLGLTPEQQASWDWAVGTYLPGLTAMVMGDKPRYLLLDIETNTVGFFDLDPAGQLANQATPSCVRSG